MVKSSMHMYLGQQVPLKMLRDKELNPTDKIVYLSIMELVESENNGDLTRIDLAEMVGVSKTTYNDAVKKLVEKKFIKVTRDNLNLPAKYELLELPYESDIEGKCVLVNDDDSRKPESNLPTHLIDILSDGNLSNFGKINKDETKKGGGENNSSSAAQPGNKTAPGLCKFFVTRYFGKFKLAYGKVSGKERGQMKRLMDEYGTPEVLELIKYTIDKQKVISGYPSISAMYGFRKTLFPESQKGVQGKDAVTSRQYKGGTWNETKGF